MRLLMVLAALMMSPVAAYGSVIVGGSGLMTQAYGDQVETWLGQGSVQFNNIFASNGFLNTLDLHAAVDGKGPTISLVEVLRGARGSTVGYQVVGGYNPQSWTSAGQYNFSPTLSERTAFIFNLSTTEKQFQSHSQDGLYQTFNHPGFGPAFGAGNDLILFAPGGLGSNIGRVNNFSYSTTPLAIANDNILAGTHDGPEFFEFGRVEIFTLTPMPAPTVPEPASALVFGGLGLIGLAARLRNKSA